MVSWAILALLCLDRLIVHMHVVLDGGHVFMPEQFLETEGIIAQDQVANGEGMAEDVRTDALVGEACPFAQASKELRHTISRQRQTCLREKQVIFVRPTPLTQFFFIGSMPIHVREHMA